MFYAVFATIASLATLMSYTGSTYMNARETAYYSDSERTQVASISYNSSYTSYSSPSTYTYSYIYFNEFCTVDSEEPSDIRWLTQRINVFSSFNGYSGNLVGYLEFYNNGIYNGTNSSDVPLNIYWSTHLVNGTNFNLTALVTFNFSCPIPTSVTDKFNLTLDFRHEQSGVYTLPSTFDATYLSYMSITSLVITYMPMSEEDYKTFAFTQEQLDDKYWEGYNKGYNDGIDYALRNDPVAATIFTGIIDIALIPVNFFLAILNFDVLGINIRGFVSALLTVAIIVIIIRIILGARSGGGGGDKE